MQKKDKNLFNVVSLRKLESILGIKRDLLRDVDKNADSYYRPFLNRKGGKLRKIDNPIGDLKFIQGRIYSRILKPINLPSTIFGGIPENSIKDMAKLHVGKKNVISLDLKDCFPRTKDKKVYALFKKIGYSHKLAALLTRLTTYNTHLPQGASTSNHLLNLILLPMHDEIQKFAKKALLTSTFWVDDIIISGDNPQLFLSEFISIIHKHGYSVRKKKVKVMSSGMFQEVTGLGVNRGIKVPKEKIKEYERNILNFKENRAFSLLLGSIEGQVQYVKYINKKQGGKIAKFKNKIIKALN